MVEVHKPECPLFNFWQSIAELNIELRRLSERLNEHIRVTLLENSGVLIMILNKTYPN